MFIILTASSNNKEYTVQIRDVRYFYRAFMPCGIEATYVYVRTMGVERTFVETPEEIRKLISEALRGEKDEPR